MSTVLKFFSRKIQPLKQCIEANQSPDSKKPNESINKQLDCEKVIKKLSKKRKFNLKLKRSIKSSFDISIKKAGIANDSTVKQSEFNENNVTEKMEISSDIFEDPKDGKIGSDTIMFNTSISANSSDRMFSHELNLEFSPLNEEFAYSVESNIDHKRASCSTYDADCFPFQSVSNSSPANYSNNSMLTYNTKYDSSNLTNDEAAMSNSESLIRQPSISITNHMQQSTPYGTKKNLNHLVKSQTTNFNSISQISETKTEVKKEINMNKKCRRSNTTYTVAGKSSRIIDYFSNLELSKPLLIKANSRQVSRQSSRKNLKDLDTEKSEDFYSIFNDIEKLQDAFFNDSSINNNNGSSSDESNQKNNSYYRKNYVDSITPSSSPSTTFDSLTSKPKSDSSGFLDESSGLKPKSNNVSNSSLENVRRTISTPQIILQNSLVLENVSKISPVKSLNSELAGSKMEETGSSSNMTETLTLINNSNKDSTQISNQFGSFKRGQPYSRSSKRIKQMFKSVLEKQMNALNKLENFYETQVVLLEQSRERDLNENPENKDVINQQYDEKLRKLEERVQTNLQYISENKSSKVATSNNNDKENKVKHLTHTISQIMLLKQLQQSNANQSKSRALVDLKSNLAIQNNLLPSKVLLKLKRKSDLFDESQHESPFKRHMSLPFKQSKNSSFDRSTNLTTKISRSPRLNSLANSSSKYNKHSSAAITLTSSPLTSIDLNTQPRIQYQKNSKKFSTSTENISQLKKMNSDLTNESIRNENVFMHGSKFAQIKRQNKSGSSIKCDFISDDKSFMNITEDIFKFHNSGFAKNTSLFGQENTSHLVKYAAPRLSDCHIHYKIKMASKNDKQMRISHNTNDQSINNMVIETEV